MAKHTPKPWIIHIDKDGGEWDWTIRTLKPHNPAGGIGKHIATVNRYLPEVEANGNTLAAAPDLLAACEALHDALSNILEDCPSEDRDGNIDKEEYEISRDHRAAGLWAIRQSFRALKAAKGEP